jgi:hypothetical protein
MTGCWVLGRSSDHECCYFGAGPWYLGDSVLGLGVSCSGASFLLYGAGPGLTRFAFVLGTRSE